MKHQFKNEFYTICSLILNETKSIEEWAEIEADDMFQEGDYVGGFDGTEMEFTISVMIKEKEYWFQLSLLDIEKVSRKEMLEVEVVEAEY